METVKFYTETYWTWVCPVCEEDNETHDATDLLNTVICMTYGTEVKLEEA